MSQNLTESFYYLSRADLKTKHTHTHAHTHTHTHAHTHTHTQTRLAACKGIHVLSDNNRPPRLRNVQSTQIIHIFFEIKASDSCLCVCVCVCVTAEWALKSRVMACNYRLWTSPTPKNGRCRRRPQYHPAAERLKLCS